MIRLDAATVLLQWATGGLFFLWLTTRRREVGLGYGWLLRSIYAVMAAGAALAGGLVHPNLLRDVLAALTALAAISVLAVSVALRRAGVSGQREREERRSARVASMTGIDRPARTVVPAGREFPPALDLIAPVIGAAGCIVAALAAGGPAGLSVARTLVGAAFLGAVTDAMLLGHWYLVQPGLGRGPLLEMVRALAIL